MNPGQPPTTQPIKPVAPPATQIGGTKGGFHTPVLDEAKLMSSYFLLLFLVLVSVYVSRIPEEVYAYFRNTLVQVLGLVCILGITHYYGLIHGILAALAFSLIISHALRSRPSSEGFTEYTPAIFISSVDGDNTLVVPKNHRWFGEKILGERPQLIREKGVSTSAIQDYSDRTMGTSSSNVSR